MEKQFAKNTQTVHITGDPSTPDSIDKLINEAIDNIVKVYPNCMIGDIKYSTCIGQGHYIPTALIIFLIDYEDINK